MPFVVASPCVCVCVCVCVLVPTRSSIRANQSINQSINRITIYICKCFLCAVNGFTIFDPIRSDDGIDDDGLYVVVSFRIREKSWALV